MINTESKQIILSILAIAVLIVAVVGVSYAVVTTTVTSSKENSLSTGTIAVELKDGGNAVSISGGMPMTDEAGKTLTGENQVFDFSVITSVSGKSTINYEISAEKLPMEIEYLPDTNVRFYLQKKTINGYEEVPVTVNPQPFAAVTSPTFLGTPVGTMVLYSGTFSNTSEEEQVFQEEFKLRMWVSSDTIIDSIRRGFKIKLNVYAKAI